MRRYDSVKRGIDLAIGVLALVLSAPVQAVIAGLVRGKLGSPVLFRQPRPGKDGEVFELVKFRTMLEQNVECGLVTDARPGITGLAQVSGRNALTWDDKLAKDVEYVDRRGLLLDLSIVLRTVAQVIKREGISAEDNVTMPEFLGSDGRA